MPIGSLANQRPMFFRSGTSLSYWTIYHHKSTACFTSKNSNFHHQELLGPLSHNVFRSSETQEPRKGGFGKGGFCRVECHAQGNKKYPRILGSAAHLAVALRAPLPRGVHFCKREKPSNTFGVRQNLLRRVRQNLVGAVAVPKLSWLHCTVQLGSGCDCADTTMTYGAGFLDKHLNQAPNYISKIKIEKIIRCNPDVKLNVIKLNSKNKINGCKHLRVDGNCDRALPQSTSCNGLATTQPRPAHNGQLQDSYRVTDVGECIRMSYPTIMWNGAM